MPTIHHHKIGLVLVFAVLGILTNSSLFSQPYGPKDLAKAQLIDQTIAKHHIAYDQLKDSVTQRLPILFLNQLDPTGRYFTAEVAEKIRQKAISLEVPMDQQVVTYLNFCHELIKQRYQETTRLLGDIAPLDFFEDDSLLLDFTANYSPYATSVIAFKKKWIRRLKYEVLLREETNQALSNAGTEEINKELNRKLGVLLEKEICKVQLLVESEQSLRDYVLERFFKAWAKSYDPHSDFFSIDLLSVFQAALSDKKYSSGLLFDNKGGKYLVSQLIPFSSASKYADLLEVGDEILSIWIEGVWTDPACKSYRELEQYFFGIISDEVKVEVQSARDGKVRTFTLAKEPIRNIENHIFSYLIKREKTSLGYIEFPVFYSDLYQKGRSAGQDLTRSILRLRREGIEGLIIDLRNNGGGSLQEAIDLAGFFIDYGPIFLGKRPGNEPAILMKDRKRGKVFEGKVIFLVNEFSASASETLVSAMQHYPNILVVGGTTFGKSTGQEIIPLISAGSEIPFGSLKLTKVRIYGVDGESYQGKGVVPDIVFPSALPSFYREADLPYSLVNIPIYRTAKLPKRREEPLQKLRENFEKRMNQNLFFRLVQQRRDSLKQLIEQPYRISLMYSPETAVKPQHNFELDTSYFQVKSLEFDEVFESQDRQLTRRLLSDPYLQETVKVFEDWLNEQ